MAITTDDFNKVWASTSPLTPYSFSESQYKEGWNFVGSTPPSRQMWDFLQKNNDEKMQYLANNYLPLSGGTLTGVVNGVTPTAGDNSKKLATTEFVNAKAGNYLPLSGGTMTTGNTLITMGNGESYVRNWPNGLYLGGTNENNASSLILYTNSNASGFLLQAGDGTTSKRMIGKPDGTLTWDGQPIQTSSDKRLKQDFSDVPADVLEAWSKVEWKQFKYIADKERKGDSCRWHTGLVAQDVQKVCGDKILKYGILCHDVQEATEEQEAVDLWTVRYTEALCMEVIYLRNEIKKLHEEIKALRPED